MNNKNIPFAGVDEEMEALQAKSEEFHAKIAALRIQGAEEHKGEIARLTQLDNSCQSAIAYYFASKQPRIK